MYAVVVGDSTGLCQVVGGKLIDSTGVTDIEADRVFNELKGQLTAKYGKPSAIEKSQVRWLKISDAAMPKNLDAITLSTAPQPIGSEPGLAALSLRQREPVRGCGAGTGSGAGRAVATDQRSSSSIFTAASVRSSRYFTMTGA